MKTNRWLVVLFVCLTAVMIGGCDNIFGPDPDEIRPSNGIYAFELEYVRFQYDTGNELMTVTNLTSVKSTVRIVRYDDRADERQGVKFTLDGFNYSRSYHEQYPRGTEIWIQIWRDAVLTEGYVRFE